ncbi:DNA N-6-adenine-methyltransferase [Mycolicibacterium fortuitum]|uniref:DNA N-6-adenine-methyltransferase n=1 Tax=Mycolicibacterium fortuitum TaxID=1766 RepID=UPI00241C259E|nr:DNA N-6-adenine-methyltransferase [Mycolicibacterium fortuitum]MDG5773914.1 DNA N-6-adenine-methyltransferase [Mycolicibacterium fortuitum]MDG5779701.1 DNA N-6-adenine-methyltransferase [Mycolicibacterium fortuitum]
MSETAASPLRNGWLGGENQQEGGRQRETRWLTPKPLVECLGEFDLDPCGAPGHQLARRTYLIDDGEDGLKLPWNGRVWLNPPYGKAALPFMRRMAAHHHGTALVFARTETAMFFETVWSVATAVLFLKGRVTFLTADGVPASANSGAPSCLVAYGNFDAQALYESAAGMFVRLRNE